MSDLIKRGDAIRAVERVCNGDDRCLSFIEFINTIPSAERKGEWIDNGDRYFRCSLCGTKDTDKWHWCHGCGHPMKGAEDE